MVSDKQIIGEVNQIYKRRKKAERLNYEKLAAEIGLTLTRLFHALKYGIASPETIQLMSVYLEKQKEGALK